MHATPDDAWVIIDGKVHDVTSWIPKHPGGSQLIAAFAGKECSDEFAAFHFPKTYLYLKSYQVGELKDGARVSEKDKAYRELRGNLWARGLFDIEPWFLACCMLRLLAFASAAFGLILCGSNFYVRAIGAVCLGLFEQQSLFMAHDFLHRAVFKTRGAAFWAGWFTGSVCGGVGAAWWKRDHFMHHALTNVVDADPSAGADPFVFIDSKQFHSKRRGAFEYFLLRMQPWLFFPLCLIFGRFNLHILSILASPAKLLDASGISLYFVWNYLLLSQVGDSGERVFIWLVAHVVCSVLHLQLSVAHLPTHMWFQEDLHHKGFFGHQVVTSMNIMCARCEHWFHGGLEYQIEHHLFPLLPRNKLGHIAPEVKKLVKDSSLPYRSEDFLQANVSCYKMLQSVTGDCLRQRSKVL